MNNRPSTFSKIKGEAVIKEQLKIVGYWMGHPVLMEESAAENIKDELAETNMIIIDREKTS